MFDFLRFIDSPDIREYNKNTHFTPAEQAVLISKSKNTTVLEKLSALKYLTKNYSDEEFDSNNIWFENKQDEECCNFKTVVLRTMEIWEDILRDTNKNEGVVYVANLQEKGYLRNDLQDYEFFTCYEKAYENLLEQKQHYLESEYLKRVETFGKIFRIPLDAWPERCSSGDEYLFDNKMELVEVKCADMRIQIDDNYLCLADSAEMFLPLPFQPGDIVKVESPFWGTYYGVFAHKWEKREYSWGINMMVSLDIWDDNIKEFDFTDDTDILGLSYCPDEELPESQKVLKAIRDVRKGNMDFYTMLCHYGPDELEGII